MKVDFKDKVAEPPVRARGSIARTYFYMRDRYQLTLSRQQTQLFTAGISSIQSPPGSASAMSESPKYRATIIHVQQACQGAKELTYTAAIVNLQPPSSRSGEDAICAKNGISSMRIPRIHHPERITPAATLPSAKTRQTTLAASCAWQRSGNPAV